MAKKLFLDRKRDVPTAQVPPISREEPESEIASSDRNSPESGRAEKLPLILDETTKSFPKFNARGRSLLIKFRPPGEEREPTGYLKECITCISQLLS